MDSFKYFHLCNHKFSITDKDSDVREVIVTNNGTFVDVLANGIRVEEILQVVALEYDVVTVEDLTLVYDSGAEFENGGFYDIDDHSIVDYSTFVDINGNPIPLPAVFFNSYLHNRIRWNVVPPQKYQVKVRSVRTDSSTKELLRADCPRCQGNGWFIDILDQDGVMGEASGINKVAQRFIKDLLTQLGTNFLDFSYGTVLYKQLSDYASALSDEKMSDNVRLVVSGVEDNYLSRQALELKLLKDDEILVRATCEKVERNQAQPTKVVIRISISTRVETRNLQIPL
jgi:hypothetical protein